MNKKQLIFAWVMVLLLSGCSFMSRKEGLFLINEQELKIEGFDSRVARIKTNMSPRQVKEVMGNPDLIDKEADIYLKDQDTVWTYKHPVIACSKFIVIFRGGGVELSNLGVRDTSGVWHYITRKEYGIRNE